jgi:hypothetical protein
VKVWSGSKTVSLHSVWDTELVRANARRPVVLSQDLLTRITRAQAASWQTGTPETWAWEAFALAQEDGYGDPPLSGTQQLTPKYVQQAKADVALQLSRAGVRLAHLLNEALR